MQSRQHLAHDGAERAPGVVFSDHDTAVCRWLETLVSRGRLDGDVLRADIREMGADDVRGYRRVHLFAGIGGWELATRMAGWPAALPLWTGSCPCQPFSAAGKREGRADERHLWPEMFRLVRECRPPVVVGEQVPGAVALGWWDEVAGGLESLGYACGAVVLPASAVGAPHRRDRLWWAAVHPDAAPMFRAALAGREPNGVVAGAPADAESVIGTRRSRPDITLAQSESGAPADTDGRPWSKGEPAERLVVGEESDGGISDSPLLAWADWNGGPAAARRLDDGIPKGLGRPAMAGFGNAIVPQVGAIWLRAVLDHLTAGETSAAATVARLSVPAGTGHVTTSVPDAVTGAGFPTNAPRMEALVGKGIIPEGSRFERRG